MTGPAEKAKSSGPAPNTVVTGGLLSRWLLKSSAPPARNRMGEPASLPM
jgi:hypothetical protein